MVDESQKGLMVSSVGFKEYCSKTRGPEQQNKQQDTPRRRVRQIFSSESAYRSWSRMMGDVRKVKGICFKKKKKKHPHRQSLKFLAPLTNSSISGQDRWFESMTRVLFTITEITGDCGHHCFFFFRRILVSIRIFKAFSRPSRISIMDWFNLFFVLFWSLFISYWCSHFWLAWFDWGDRKRVSINP